MNRRDFTKISALSVASSSLLGVPWGCSNTGKKDEARKPSLINTLYYRANTFHYNPFHIAADLQWMADHGTQAVTLAISEPDFIQAIRNIETIVSEAHKRNIKVFFVTSRWAGIFAGAPKAPSLFAAKNPHTWSLNSKGEPYFHSSGPICSIYYEEVFEFFTRSLDRVLNQWGLDGVVWDEPKAYQMDYSEKAIEALGTNGTVAQHEANYCEYISQLNQHIRNHHGDKVISFFAYPYLSENFIEESSRIRHLDYFGSDGRGYPIGERPENIGGKKFLLGEGAVGMRYVTKAREKNLKSMVLIENFRTQLSEHPLLEKYLDEIITMVDQFAYYYYPRSCEAPDETMKLITSKLKHFV